MMQRRISVRVPFVAMLALAIAALLLPQFARAEQPISQTATAGKYSVTLKVLPAETFKGADAAMVHDGGAMAVMVNGPTNPNHHMVVFIEENSQPVKHAHVKIRYRMSMPGMNNWTKLPVARMYVKGKGTATTHFGNNVMLMPGKYEVRVTVNHKTAIFHFTL